MIQPDENGVAFAGDWHANSRFAESMIYSIAMRKCKAIVHTGDYGYRFFPHFIENVEHHLADADIMLYFIDGNHDDHGLLNKLDKDDDGLGILSEHQRFIPRAHRWTWYDLTWLGLGGAVSVDKRWRQEGVSWWATEQITDEQVAAAIAPGGADVLVCHDVPAGVDLWWLRGDWPADVLEESARTRLKLSQVVRKTDPRLIVHGHHHTRYNATLGRANVIGLAGDQTDWDSNIYIARFDQ